MIINPDSAGMRQAGDPDHLAGFAERLAIAWQENRMAARRTGSAVPAALADAYLRALADLLLLRINATQRMLHERWPDA